MTKEELIKKYKEIQYESYKFFESKMRKFIDEDLQRYGEENGLQALKEVVSEIMETATGINKDIERQIATEEKEKIKQEIVKKLLSS